MKKYNAIASHYQDHTLTDQRTQNNVKTSVDLRRVQNEDKFFVFDQRSPIDLHDLGMFDNRENDHL